MRISEEVELRVKDREKKTTLKTRVRESVEERTIVRDLTGKRRPLQIKWEGGKIVHLHCLPCDNPWGRNQALGELNTKFDVKENIVKCKKCGSKWRMGGGV
jgi:NAD-dependent SIR2 family protein deacetylase